MAVAARPIEAKGLFSSFQTKLNFYLGQSTSSINKYVILPISESNRLRNQVIAVCEVACAVLCVFAFSATLHLTIKTASILGKGLGVITGVCFLDGISLLAQDIGRRILFKEQMQDTQEEKLAKFLRNASQEEFKRVFKELTGLELEQSYTPSVQLKIRQETDCDPFYKGLVPILVRFAHLKEQLEKKQVSLERFFSGKKPSKHEKLLLEQMKSTRLLESFQIKLEVALALVIIQDPFIELEQGIEEIGYFNEVVLSDKATCFLETDTPYFISHDVKQQKNLHKSKRITFMHMQECSLSRLAKKLVKMLED